MDEELKEAETRSVGRRVREELARRRLSRQALADLARVSLSTLEKALAGTRPFTLATTIRLEECLGVRLRDTPVSNGGSLLAPEAMGSYARAAVGWLEGRYLALRPSFGTPGAIYAYIITIRWLDDAGHLGFAETQRTDIEFEQAGHVSLSNLSGHIYLVTNEAGQHRLMVLSRPTIAGTLLGILTTLQVGHGSQLVPIACPIAMMKIGSDAQPSTGLIDEHADCHAKYFKTLRTATEEDFARFPQLI